MAGRPSGWAERLRAALMGVVCLGACAQAPAIHWHPALSLGRFRSGCAWSRNGPGVWFFDRKTPHRSACAVIIQFHLVHRLLWETAHPGGLLNERQPQALAGLAAAPGPFRPWRWKLLRCRSTARVRRPLSAKARARLVSAENQPRSALVAWVVPKNTAHLSVSGCSGESRPLPIPLPLELAIELLPL